MVDIEETAPLATLTSAQLDEANAIDSTGQASAVIYGKMYGGLKALCEQAVGEVFRDRALIIRPGLIVGLTTTLTGLLIGPLVSPAAARYWLLGVPAVTFSSLMPAT